MNKVEEYHRWVAWSDEDSCYIGCCPDLFLGGVHDDDPIKCAKRLHWAIEDIAADCEAEDKWPPVTIYPARTLSVETL
jgi:hypothetical protein